MTLKSSLAYFVTRSSLNFTKHPITRRAKPKICNARVFSDYDSYQKYFVHTLYVRGDKSKLNNYIHVFLLCISLTGVWNLIDHVNEDIFASRSEGEGGVSCITWPTGCWFNQQYNFFTCIIPKIWEGHVGDFHLKVESYCYGLSRFAAKMKLFTGLSSFNYSFVKISL